MQRVIADFYNHALETRGKVDVFSIVKFRPKTNGTVNTTESGLPGGIKTDQAWIGETPVGDWFYRPGFDYESKSMIRNILEAASRDGGVAICISLLPDGSLDDGSRKMLAEVGAWMRCERRGHLRQPRVEGAGRGPRRQSRQLPAAGSTVGRRSFPSARRTSASPWARTARSTRIA